MLKTVLLIDFSYLAEAIVTLDFLTSSFKISSFLPANLSISSMNNAQSFEINLSTSILKNCLFSC